MMTTGPTRFTYFKCDGFEVWGKEYQGSNGESIWRLRVFADQDRKIATYEDVAGDPPEGTRTGEQKAMRDAIAAWLAPAQDQPDAYLSDPPPAVERVLNVPQIRGTMTIHEAAPLWEDPRAVHLKRWGETFGITLEEFHIGHIVTYESDRLREVNYATMWTEVIALRALLKNVGVGEEIEAYYLSPVGKMKPGADELSALAPRARAYIEYLEREVSGLKASNNRMKGIIRKINQDGTH
jgi:hypothetical protein